MMDYRGGKMIYGYDSSTVDEFGLKQMREISLCVTSSDLRDLAVFLRDTTDELDNPVSEDWHRHLPQSLKNRTGCDVIVLKSE